MKAEGVKKDKGFFTSMHPSVLIFLLIILATIATYVVPAGLYDRYTDETLKRTLIDPTSYHRVEQTPVNPFQMMQAISTGMNEAGWIIF
ncbi:MAG: C4-dicarboxylate ABC transporter permease, partial [Clostridia bacterium]|nr:C4-dicarboxylate ABC transporter permease [Clostridia bacterium]